MRTEPPIYRWHNDIFSPAKRSLLVVVLCIVPAYHCLLQRVSCNMTGGFIDWKCVSERETQSLSTKRSHERHVRLRIFSIQKLLKCCHESWISRHASGDADNRFDHITFINIDGVLMVLGVEGRFIFSGDTPRNMLLLAMGSH